MKLNNILLLINIFLIQRPSVLLNKFHNNLINKTEREFGVIDFNTLVPKFFNLYGNGLIGRVEYHF